MLYIIALRFDSASQPFSWSETHNHDAYSAIFMVASNGVLFWDRWVWLVTGAFIFLFFGCGSEAIGTYRQALLKVGLGKLFPALGKEKTRRPTMSTISSISSKARMLFKRKDSMANTTWTTSVSPASPSHNNNASDEPISPETATFLETIREVRSDRDLEKAAPPPTRAKPSLFSRIASLVSSVTHKRSSAPMGLTELTNETTTVRSEVSAGQRPASLIQHVRDTSSDVLVRKEVRQGSRHGAT